METEYADLETIRERMAQRELAERARRVSAERRAETGRRQTARTRERLRSAVYSHHRRAALAAEDTHPLRRARLTFRGDGLTIRQLADRAMVSPDTIQHVETRQVDPTRLTMRRLARALGTSVADLTDD